MIVQRGFCRWNLLLIFSREISLLDAKVEKFKLSWLDSQTGKKHPAGVAFYNEQEGEYRLKIDTFSDEKLIYLKPGALSDGVIHYRVEATVKQKGQFRHRAEIGVGSSDADKGYPIFMDIGPFSRTLVLEQSV